MSSPQLTTLRIGKLLETISSFCHSLSLIGSCGKGGGYADHDVTARLRTSDEDVPLYILADGTLLRCYVLVTRTPASARQYLLTLVSESRLTGLEQK